jgi:hypothetical protein
MRQLLHVGRKLHHDLEHTGEYFSHHLRDPWVGKLAKRGSTWGSRTAVDDLSLHITFVGGEWPHSGHGAGLNRLISKHCPQLLIFPQIISTELSKMLPKQANNISLKKAKASEALPGSHSDSLRRSPDPLSHLDEPLQLTDHISGVYLFIWSQNSDKIHSQPIIINLGNRELE